MNSAGPPSDRILDPVGGRTVASLLEDGASRHPERPLLVYDPLDGPVETYSWGEMSARANAVAATLSTAGVKPGAAIHLHLGNRPEFLLTWFAAALLGARIVPTNDKAVAAELAYVLGHARAEVSVTDRDGADVVAAAQAQARGSRISLICEDGLESEAGGAPRPAAAPRADQDLAVLYTSGTTSRPKGVRLTHANYVYAGEVVAGALRMRPEDRFLTVLPLFHANAQFYSTMSTLVSGGTLVLARRFSAGRFVELARRHRATLASLFAAPIRMILAQDPDAHGRDHDLRAVVYAQDLSVGEEAAWGEGIAAPLLQLYGMTETVGPPLINPLHGPRRRDAIGRPIPGYACRIVDADGGPTPDGEPGELLVGGTPGVSLMAGYLDDPAATAGALRDGWLHTGDLVRRDADGLVAFVGRSGDIIKRAGENVAAAEVEAVLLDHPAVLDAAVVGVADPVRDEEVIGFVVLRPGAEATEEELRAWCAERLASFRVPSAVSIHEGLPRTAVGKIQKHLLRDAWEGRAGPAD